MVRYEGTILAWTGSLGFGFVQWDEDGGALFVEAGALRGMGRPAVGERVSYEVARNEKGFYRAINVTRLPAQPVAPASLLDRMLGAVEMLCRN